MSNDTFWNDEQDAQLRDMASKGYPGSAIARAMDKSRSAICGRAWRIGVRLRGISGKKGKPGPKRKHLSPEQVLEKRPTHRATVPKPKIFARNPDFNSGELAADRAPEDALMVSLVNLKHGMCKWPFGEGRGIRFCGLKQDYDSPYCLHHKKASRKEEQ